MIFSESDVCDLLMQGRPLESLNNLIIEESVDTSQWPQIIDPMPNWIQQKIHSCSISEFHSKQQSQWHMPDEYKNLDIASYILNLCTTQDELQRCGQELLMYQERNLFDLLRYLKYLVDVMRQNQIIWGVGRGSSVSSYVLFKLGVHRVDSMYYNLDVAEFLR